MLLGIAIYWLGEIYCPLMRQSLLFSNRPNGPPLNKQSGTLSPHLAFYVFSISFFWAVYSKVTRFKVMGNQTDWRLFGFAARYWFVSINPIMLIFWLCLLDQYSPGRGRTER